MKEFGKCSVLAVSAFCFLSWLSPLKAYATTVNMDFAGVGGPNSGGVYTYPYDFSINGGSPGPAHVCQLLSRRSINRRPTRPGQPLSLRSVHR
jgi:hypothetical protein